MGATFNEGHDGAQGLAVAANWVGAILDRNHRTVGPTEDILLIKRPLARPERPEDRAILNQKGGTVRVRVVDELMHVPSEDLLGRIEAQELERGGVAEGA